MSDAAADRLHRHRHDGPRHGEEPARQGLPADLQGQPRPLPARRPDRRRRPGGEAATPRWRAAPTSSSSASPARRRSRSIVHGPEGLLSSARNGLMVVDTSTAEPSSTERLRADFAPPRHALHRRAAGAHAEGSRGRAAEHHGRRRARRLRSDQAGAAGVLRERLPRRPAGLGPCAQAGQQHAGDVDGGLDRRGRRGRGQERARRSRSCSRWSRPAASTPASSR